MIMAAAGLISPPRVSAASRIMSCSHGFAGWVVVNWWMAGGTVVVRLDGAARMRRKADRTARAARLRPPFTTRRFSYTARRCWPGRLRVVSVRLVIVGDLRRERSQVRGALIAETSAVKSVVMGRYGPLLVGP